MYRSHYRNLNVYDVSNIHSHEIEMVHLLVSTSMFMLSGNIFLISSWIGGVLNLSMNGQWNTLSRIDTLLRSIDAPISSWEVECAEVNEL